MPLDWGVNAAPSRMRDDIRQSHAQWSRYVALCQSLAKEGFDYTVEFKGLETAGMGDWITITISGTATGKLATPRKPAKRALTMVAKVTPEKCRKMAGESRRAALSGVVPQRRRMSAWEYDAKRRAEDRRIGHLIARAKARGESTIMTPADDWHSGFLVSVGATITARKQRPAYYAGEAPHPMEARQARLAALAEYKFWQEMESLTGQRDKLRPGVADTLCVDDEIAA